MIKALFFDIDGTLVSFGTHAIPKTTVTALEQAKNLGVGIYISTGRPFQIINNIGTISHLVDGYITTNGGLCFVGDTVVSRKPIHPDDVATILQWSDRMMFPMMVVGERSFHIHNPNKQLEDIFVKLLNVTNSGDGVCLQSVLQQNILQLTPVITPRVEELLMREMPHSVSARWYPTFTDITARGADKGSALLAMANHLGLDISETMAFGDGGNDISILRAAGTGIAMGNATDNVKAAADYVTTSVDQDGVANALKHFGVI